MLSIILVASIAVAVVLGYKTKIQYRILLYRVRLPDRMFRYGDPSQKS